MFTFSVCFHSWPLVAKPTLTSGRNLSINVKTVHWGASCSVQAIFLNGNLASKIEPLVSVAPPPPLSLPPLAPRHHRQGARMRVMPIYF